MTLRQPTAFSSLANGFDSECPCCRRKLERCIVGTELLVQTALISDTPRAAIACHHSDLRGPQNSLPSAQSHTDSLAIGCEPSVIATDAGKQVAVLCVGRPRLGSERQAANLLGSHPPTHVGRKSSAIRMTHRPSSLALIPKSE